MAVECLKIPVSNGAHVKKQRLIKSNTLWKQQYKVKTKISGQEREGAQRVHKEKEQESVATQKCCVRNLYGTHNSREDFSINTQSNQMVLFPQELELAIKPVSPQASDIFSDCITHISYHWKNQCVVIPRHIMIDRSVEK